MILRLLSDCSPPRPGSARAAAPWIPARGSEGAGRGAAPGSDVTPGRPPPAALAGVGPGSSGSWLNLVLCAEAAAGRPEAGSVAVGRPLCSHCAGGCDMGCWALPESVVDGLQRNISIYGQFPFPRKTARTNQRNTVEDKLNLSTRNRSNGREECGFGKTESPGPVSAKSEYTSDNDVTRVLFKLLRCLGHKVEKT